MRRAHLNNSVEKLFIVVYNLFVSIVLKSKNKLFLDANKLSPAN